MLKRIIGRIARPPIRRWLAYERDRHNVELVLAAALRETTPTFPVRYVEFLRGCVEHKHIPVVTIKAVDKRGDASALRFVSILQAFNNLPAMPMPVAESIARVADRYATENPRHEDERWHTDVRTNVEVSSSFGAKGRILAAVVRFGACRSILELGTAYGLSTLFMALTNPEASVTTIEADERQFRLSSEMLRTVCGERIRCKLGLTRAVLPTLADHPPIDMVFHDAGHSREDYIKDFQAMESLLAVGTLVLIDDIRWNDPRFYDGDPRTYEGWQQLTQHERVRAAVEIDRTMGLLLLG